MIFISLHKLSVFFCLMFFPFYLSLLIKQNLHFSRSLSTHMAYYKFFLMFLIQRVIFDFILYELLSFWNVFKPKNTVDQLVNRKEIWLCFHLNSFLNFQLFLIPSLASICQLHLSTFYFQQWRLLILPLWTLLLLNLFRITLDVF